MTPWRQPQSMDMSLRCMRKQKDNLRPSCVQRNEPKQIMNTMANVEAQIVSIRNNYNPLNSLQLSCFCMHHVPTWLFAKFEMHDKVIGKCVFCRMEMPSLPPVPLDCYTRLNIPARPNMPKWKELALLFCKEGGPVKTLFPGTSG